MTEPTDAEIIALADETRTAEGGANGYILPISFARAVLAKWGAQQPVVREPLTDEWIRSRCKEPWVFETAKQWVRMAEAAHGINKGGLHGTD